MASSSSASVAFSNPSSPMLFMSPTPLTPRTPATPHKPIDTRPRTHKHLRIYGLSLPNQPAISLANDTVSLFPGAALTWSNFDADDLRKVKLSSAELSIAAEDVPVQIPTLVDGKEEVFEGPRLPSEQFVMDAVVDALWGRLQYSCYEIEETQEVDGREVTGAVKTVQCCFPPQKDPKENDFVLVDTDGWEEGEVMKVLSSPGELGKGKGKSKL